MCSSVESEDHLDGKGCVIRGQRTVSWDRRALLGERSPTTSTSSRGYWAGWTLRLATCEIQSIPSNMSLGRAGGFYSFLSIHYRIKLSPV